MASDRFVGAALMVIAIAGSLLYVWGLLTPGWDLILLKLTAGVAVVGLLAILGWIGYSLATVPPPEELTPELDEEEKAESSGEIS